MGTITIAGERFDVDHARIDFSHCADSEADWDLAIYLAQSPDIPPLRLAGAVSPSPRKDLADLEGAELRVELRSLDQLAGALLGRQVTLYPQSRNGCELRLSCRASGEGRARLAADFDFDWDRFLETFASAAPRLHASIDLEVEMGERHLGPRP